MIEPALVVVRSEVKVSVVVSIEVVALSWVIAPGKVVDSGVVDLSVV